MPVHTEPIAQVELKSLDEVAEWIHSTQDNLKRIPVAGVLEHGATMRDDQYLGDGEVLFCFNESGFQSFCQKLGFRADQLARLETPSLASQVLNDVLSQREIRERLLNEEFVVDELTNTIIGVVSGTYVTYSNREFMDDVLKLLDRAARDHDLQFQEGYGINTELTLRLTSEKRHGWVDGRGGQGEDRSKLGLDLRNTMVGDSSVRINYFLHRLACANGLMVPAAESINRIFHSGRKDTFHERLNRGLSEAIRNFSQLHELLGTLGGLPFEPEKLAKTQSLADAIFEVISGSKQALSERANLFLRYPRDASTADREQMRREHDARLIKLIPQHFGGELSHKVFKSGFRDKVSLFDFINVFTEHAKSASPTLKLEIEAKAGALAKYIAKNARKL